MAEKETREENVLTIHQDGELQIVNVVPLDFGACRTVTPAVCKWGLCETEESQPWYIAGLHFGSPLGAGDSFSINAGTATLAWHPEMTPARIIERIERIEAGHGWFSLHGPDDEEITGEALDRFSVAAAMEKHGKVFVRQPVR